MIGLDTRIIRRVSAAAVGMAACFYLGWELIHRGIYAYATDLYPLDDADEWRYTACSRLVRHGYSMFDQVFSAQPPLFFWSLAGGMRLFGDSILGARGTEILCGLLALLSAAALSWLLGSAVSSAATALLLAVSPSFLVYSHAVESEVPMVALCTLSLALTAVYRRHRHLVWPLLGGCALGAGVLMKLFAIETVLPGAVIIVTAAWPSRRAIILSLLAFVGAMLIPVVLDFALLAPSEQWRQVIQMHSRAAGISLPHLIPPIDQFHRYVSFEPGLAAAAAGGALLLLIAGRWSAAAVTCTWFGGSVIMLLVFRPLFPHHLAILTCPLAVTAAVGVSGWAESLSRRRAPQDRRAGSVPVPTRTLRSRGSFEAVGPFVWDAGAWRRWLALFTAACLGVVYVAGLPHLVHADRHVLIAESSPASVPLAMFLRRNTAPNQFVAVDDLRIADGASRLVAPPLCDPSNVRLRAGYLISRDAISATETYHVAMVIPSSGIYDQIRGYIPWLRKHFGARRAGGLTVYLRR